MQLKTTPAMLDSCQGTSDLAKHGTSSEYVLMHYETIDQLIADARTAHAFMEEQFAIAAALDEALPEWNDPDDPVTTAEAIRRIYRNHASGLLAEHYDMGSEVAADHSAGLRCHKCGGRLSPPGGLGGCAACKVSAAENLKNEEGTRGTSAATPPPDVTEQLRITERTRNAAQAEANRLLSDNRELRKDIDAYCTFVEAIRRINIQSLLEDQRRWSAATFGPGYRTAGILAHIRKELAEIEADPHDLEEWIDVILLAIDGFWRHGGWDLAAALWAKRQPMEHVKEQPCK